MKKFIIFNFVVFFIGHLTVLSNDADTVWMRWTDITPTSIDISPDCNYIAISDQNNVELYDLQTGTKLNTATSITGGIFTKDSKFIIGFKDSVIKILDINNWDEVRSLEKCPDNIRFISYNSDSTKLIASFVYTDGFYIWDIASGELLESVIFDASKGNEFHTGALQVEFTKNDEKIIYGSWYQENPYNPHSIAYTLTKILSNDSYHQEFYKKFAQTLIQISPQRNYILTWKNVNQEAIGAELINLENMEPVLFIEGNSQTLRDFAFSPGEDFLSIVYNDNKGFEIWSVSKKIKVYSYLRNPLSSYLSICPSLDGNYICAGTNKRLYLYKSYWSNLSVSENLIMATITYPNPASNMFNLDFNLSENSQTIIDIIDINGKLVKSIENAYLNAGRHLYSINISDLPAGMYTLRINSGKYFFNQSIIKN